MPTAEAGPFKENSLFWTPHYGGKYLREWRPNAYHTVSDEAAKHSVNWPYYFRYQSRDITRRPGRTSANGISVVVFHYQLLSFYLLLPVLSSALDSMAWTGSILAVVPLLTYPRSGGTNQSMTTRPTLSCMIRHLVHLRVHCKWQTTY